MGRQRQRLMQQKQKQKLTKNFPGFQIKTPSEEEHRISINNAASAFHVSF